MRSFHLQPVEVKELVWIAATRRKRLRDEHRIEVIRAKVVEIARAKVISALCLEAAAGRTLRRWRPPRVAQRLKAS